MTQAQRAVVRRLLERLAETLCGNSAASELARIAPEDPLCFAWAGGLDRGMYCRLHGEHFAVEYVRLPGGLGVHAAWRHFERDAGAPWLCDQLPATRAR